MDKIYRSGIGFDVHKLVEGRKCIIGGVDIPYEKGLLGHSDADVLLHAISDALLGAAGLGDIGTYFPDTDPAFKGADSFLLVVRGEAGTEQQLSGLLAKAKLSRLKSKTVTARGYEITFEVRVDKPDAFLNRVLQVNGVQDATLVAYQNETT